ncbi:MAG: GNAT family N-acetyltransferase [Amylibacter sp.]|nr:GNAT family N-acetyltransferase [Amylibacter sp.]
MTDHRKEEQEIAGWLVNKTVESWALWVSDAASRLYVADYEGEILGVGMISEKGEILLNYVNPDARFHGVSKALLEHMEASVVAQGLACCSLESTKTAYQFYSNQATRHRTLAVERKAS